MSKDLLNTPQICSPFEQMRCCGVPQVVRTHHIKVSVKSRLVQLVTNLSRIPPSPANSEEKALPRMWIA